MDLEQFDTLTPSQSVYYLSSSHLNESLFSMMNKSLICQQQNSVMMTISIIKCYCCMTYYNQRVMIADE